jgi:hypothetical protein
MGRSVTSIAVATVLATALVTGCTNVVTDPRGIDAERAKTLERAAYAGEQGAGAAGDARVADQADGGREPGGKRPAGFDLLRPAAQARTHPLSDLWGPGAFAIFDDGKAVFEWRNRDQLWNEIVVPVGESCRRAGAPIRQPLFDGPEPLAAAVDPYWNHRSTSGRGTLISVMCAYVDEDKGPMERYEAVLVATDPSTQHGRVVARSQPWTLAAADYATVGDLVAARDRAMAAWVREQGRVEADPIAPSPDRGVDATDSPDADSGAR